MPQTKPGSIEERLVSTVLNRHDEVGHLLVHAPGDYYPIFMHDKGKTIVAIFLMRMIGKNLES